MLRTWGWGNSCKKTPSRSTDHVLVPLNVGTPGIHPSPTNGPPDSHTHFTKSWRPLLLLLLSLLLK